MITERDIKILKFLNDFGYARTSIIRELFFNAESSDTKRTCQLRLKKLYDDKFLQRERDFKYGEHVFYLTKKVKQLLSSYQIQPYQVYDQIGWSTYIHNDFVLQSYLALRKIGFKGYISERSMKYKDLFEKIRPDLIVKNETHELFIEVELVSKTVEQYERKLRRLSKQKTTVVYLVQSKFIHQRIKKIADALSFNLVILNIIDFLDRPVILKDKI